MLDISALSWLSTLFSLLLASAAGVAVASRFPWSDDARQGGIPLAAGLSLGPLLAGMAGVLALLLLPGRSSHGHLIMVALILMGLCALYRGLPRPTRTNRFLFIPAIQKISFLEIVLFLWMAVLAVLPMVLPLTQNDALEYATVGRVVFDARDLSAYPAIHPEMTASGFFGPWTHPPLFVALIYLAYSLQGTDIAPGLARLITPWFAITCVFLTYRLAARLSKPAGLFAALVFISCPLFFLGADSSLIDSLPIAGLLLGFTILVHGDRHRPALTSAVAGIALGFSLWTHSQAILFIPLLVTLLFAMHGLRDMKGAALKSLCMLSVALVLCAYPYLRNYEIFGALISDNPVVFALPSLRWEDYFSLGRGIAEWPAKIQYGLFKGWFTPESYSGSFWLATAGLVLFVWRYARATGTLVMRGVAHVDRHLAFLYAVFIIVVAYLSAVLISVLMGVDLAIRNERYWLILLPFISIFAGWAISAALTRLERARSSLWALGFVSLAGLVLLAQLAVLGLYRVNPYLSVMQAGSQSPSSQWWVACETSPPETSAAAGYCPAQSITAEGWQRALPSLLSMQYVSAMTPRDSVVFTMFPAMMYYSQRKMVSYLDPRLLPFYEARTAEEAAAVLRGLSIDYLHVTSYYLPPVYHSKLQEILFREDLSTLVFSAEGDQIYKLAPERHSTPVSILDITPGRTAWTRETVWALGGRKSFGRSALIGGGGDAFSGGTSRLELPYGLFQRNRAVSLRSGSPQATQPEDSLIRVSPRIPVGLRIRFGGYGYMQFSVEQYDASYTYIGSISLGDISVTEDPATWTFERRFIPSRDASFIRVTLSHSGQSHVKIESAELLAREPATGGRP